MGSSAFGVNYWESKCERLSGVGSRWHSLGLGGSTEGDSTWICSARGWAAAAPPEEATQVPLCVPAVT